MAVLSLLERLALQDDAQKGLVDLQDSPSAAVLDEAQFSEFVHEQIDPRACCANHLRQHLLRNRGNSLLRLVLFAIARGQHQSARQPLLDGVKEMVDEVFLDSFVSLQKISDEAVGERDSSWSARIISSFSVTRTVVV